MDSTLADRRVPPLPGELEAMNEPERIMSLQKCLNVFADGLKEEQTWAVTYQTIKEFKLNCTTDTNLNRNDGKMPLRCCEKLDQLLISSHGRCFIDTNARLAQDQSEAIACLGELMFSSLDYGLDQEIERDLSPSLENLVEQMAIANDDNNNVSLDSHMQQEEDEEMSSLDPNSMPSNNNHNHENNNNNNHLPNQSSNSPNHHSSIPNPPDLYENESCIDTNEEISDFISYDRILKLCSQHIGRPNRADNHYLNVCRAIVATAVQLEKFLNQINNANEALKKMSKKTPNKNGNDLNGTLNIADIWQNNELEQHLELDTSQWASLWMQCMSELRKGVTLKHCEKRHSPIPTQFEMSPYEMLMADIQHKNWKLKKSPANLVNGEISLTTRRNAHQIIMEHIRARPSLVPTNRRHLKPAPPKKQTLHEKIMGEIKKPSSRALLRFTETKQSRYSIPVGNVLPDNFNKTIDQLNNMNNMYDNIHNCQDRHTLLNQARNSHSQTSQQPQVVHRNKQRSYSHQIKTTDEQQLIMIMEAENNNMQVEQAKYNMLNKRKIGKSQSTKEDTSTVNSINMSNYSDAKRSQTSQNLQILNDIETEDSSTDTSSTDELGYEDEDERRARKEFEKRTKRLSKQANSHCFERFDHKTENKKRKNLRADMNLMNLNDDDAMDITLDVERNRSTHSHSQKSNHSRENKGNYPEVSQSQSRKKVPLDSWNSSLSTSRNSSSVNSPFKHGNIYANPAITESCGNILSQLNHEDDSDDDDDDEDYYHQSKSRGRDYQVRNYDAVSNTSQGSKSKKSFGMFKHVKSGRDKSRDSRAGLRDKSRDSRRSMIVDDQAGNYYMDETTDYGDNTSINSIKSSKSNSKKSKKDKKKKKKSNKDDDDGYFKRSYTVHGLSSAARKLRRSFGKGSQKSLNSVGLGNHNFEGSEINDSKDFLKANVDLRLGDFELWTRLILW